MAQPTPYSRQYNFQNYQSITPASPLPADKVDLELNSVKATLDQVLNNLKIIQRDDTALANSSVGVDQLKAEVSIGINPPTPWVTGHPYVKNDSVTENGVFYRCLVSHTSGTFATDLAAGDWTVVIDFNTVGYDLGANIHAATAKTVPNDLDEVALSDSAQSWAVKKITWAQIAASVWSALGGLIGTGTGKTAPVDADAVPLMDSAASNATKSLTVANLATAVFTRLGALIAAATGKTTPVDADGVLLSDSAAGGAGKLLTIANLKTAVYAAIGAKLASETAKTTPVDGDGLLLTDSAAAGANKLLTWANLKATLNGLYATAAQGTKADGALQSAGGTITGNLQVNGTLNSGSTLSENGVRVYSASNPPPAGGGVGVGQTWQDVTASRAAGTSYLNSTGNPIQVLITESLSIPTSGGKLSISSDNSTWTDIATTAFQAASGNNSSHSLNAIIPNGIYYKVTNNSGTGISKWAELR